MPLGGAFVFFFMFGPHRHQFSQQCQARLSCIVVEEELRGVRGGLYGRLALEHVKILKD